LTQRLLNLNTDGHVAGERTLRSLNVIGAQTRKLALLLDQLLDTSRLEAGRLAIEPQPVDLARLAQEVAATTRLVTNLHSIIVTTPPELAAQADPLRLEQVLLNLLDNALRHSPDGGRIDVTLARQASGAIELTVQDQGPGIPAEHREQVFERYHRVHSNGRGSGLGLGLHICREIVELHGGSIRVECPTEGGSRFVVELPIGIARPVA
ncbi:MAG TPA: ATP-binding protein, partial [Thermomicrobiales bacterium]|nr:ATP-binding protein [Thermomicrobiales bacterium]